MKYKYINYNCNKYIWFLIYCLPKIHLKWLISNIHCCSWGNISLFLLEPNLTFSPQNSLSFPHLELISIIVLFLYFYQSTDNMSATYTYVYLLRSSCKFIKHKTTLLNFDNLYFALHCFIFLVVSLLIYRKERTLKCCCLHRHFIGSGFFSFQKKSVMQDPTLRFYMYSMKPFIFE